MENPRDLPGCPLAYCDREQTGKTILAWQGVISKGSEP